MLPLLPFVAGVAVGVYAANALRRSDVRENLQRSAKTLFDAAQATVQQCSEQWRAQCEQWGQAHAPDVDEEGEHEDAADSDLDDDAYEAPCRRSTRRGGRRRSRREEPDSGFDAEDDAPASEVDGDENERA